MILRSKRSSVSYSWILFFFFVHSPILCLLIEKFNPFTFQLVTDMRTLLPFIFCMLIAFLSISSITAFLCVQLTFCSDTFLFSSHFLFVYSIDVFFVVIMGIRYTILKSWQSTLNWYQLNFNHIQNLYSFTAPLPSLYVTDVTTYIIIYWISINRDLYF